MNNPKFSEVIRPNDGASVRFPRTDGDVIVELELEAGGRVMSINVKKMTGSHTWNFHELRIDTENIGMMR